MSANIVDEILRRYGTAFDVGYDLTNMSNMGGMGMSNMGGNAPLSRSINMTTSHNSPNSNMLEGHSNMPMMTAKGDLGLVNTYDYQTSQILAPAFFIGGLFLLMLANMMGDKQNHLRC